MKRNPYCEGALVALVFLLAMASDGLAQDGPAYRSPQAIVASPDGARLYIAEGDANAVAVWDVAQGVVSATIPLEAEPTGLAFSPDAARLYVTCAAPAGSVAVIDTASHAVVDTLPAGYGARGPVISPEGGRLYVCNRFTNDVSFLDTATKQEIARVPVNREPFAAAVTPDGARLYVANLLPAGRADADFCAASISVIDTTSREVHDVPLPNGSGGVRGLCISPDGRYVYAAHILARFHMPTTQLERGWMNTNALSVIDAVEGRRINTVLLDDVDLGAANPWGVACNADGGLVCVTHAGSHELSVIDVPALIAKLNAFPAVEEKIGPVTYPPASKSPEDVPNDLSFLVGVRRRIPLAGHGPRAVAIVGDFAYVPEYFTDSMSQVDLRPDVRRPVTPCPLGPEQPMTSVRKGHLFFNDARFCFQHWQSCASCHPDARADGLNWDLLNDGIGNPKNAKSMLLSHETPPVMSLGVRDKAETAVRAGIKYIQFAVRPEEDAQAIDEYLKGLKPVPSPWIVEGALSAEAQRGRELFFSTVVGCGACHPEPLYTDLQMHDVGTQGALDRQADFDTPQLVEIWRTAPYLHDGRAVTLMEVLTTANTDDRHGRTSHLTDEERHDLEVFLRSL
ncbi:MAG TPA: cell surface protein [Candidatus Hydrogenedentes bacterium]|nr:cell surface protein [Candidatus Hydrogenedentota bacterium]